MMDRSLDLVKIDFSPAHRPPAKSRVALATLVSLGGSLLADALLVMICTAVYPSTKGYVHFQFHEYFFLAAGRSSSHLIHASDLTGRDFEKFRLDHLVRDHRLDPLRDVVE